MSAQHIYHTALPLSPETSILRQRFSEGHPSWEKDRTTQQASPGSHYDTWGDILRTIKADSGTFIHLAAVGKSIVAVREEDSVIDIYDAVTGVLRLSLNAPRQVAKAEGSSDGSVLFCAHQRSCEITMWDMQTGGLVHTFTTEFEVNDIAASSTGRHLGSCSSDGAFRFWEVESGYGGSRSLGEAVASICWLEPEDQVALALKATVVVLDVTTGRMLHSFPVGENVRGIVFSANRCRLAVWLSLGVRNTIKVIDIQTGLVLLSPPPLTHVSCFTFSGNGDRVVCAMGTGDLRWFSVSVPSVGWHKYLSHLGTIRSMGLLPNGHLVVNGGGSIQVLAMISAKLSSTGQDPEISHIYPLDNGKAICASPRDRRDVSLLDMETMKTLASYPVAPDSLGISLTPRILCISIDRRVTILNFPEYGLKPHVIRSVTPKWEHHPPQPVLSVALSPGGGELVAVVESAAGGWGLHVADVSDGCTLFFATQVGRSPRNVAFTSETEFHTEGEDEGCHEETHRTQEPQRAPTRTAPISTSEANSDRCMTRYVRTTFVFNPRSPTDKVRKLSEESVLLTRPYELDRNLEWVVDATSRRVCWLPPGYVRGTENGHFFIGSSIIMAGQDGIVRRLTFGEPRPDWWCT